MNPKKYKIIAVVASLLFFSASLTQPAFYVEGPKPEAWSDSLSLFLLGWMGFLGGSIESLLWVANPIYILSIVTYLKSKSISLITAWIATGLALIFYLLPDILVSESGRREKIASFENGYKLWVASMLVLAIGITITTILINKRNANTR